jgi:hypothetical protein
MTPSVLRSHPCPECFGNVRWYARQCPHCETDISLADRFDWLSEPAKAAFFTGLIVVLFLAGWSLLLLAEWLL